MCAATPNPRVPPSRLTAQRLTPPGTGAIALIRVAGPGAADVVARFFRPISGVWPTAQSTGRLAYGNWIEPRADRADCKETESERRDHMGVESDALEPEVIDDVIVCAVRADGTDVEVSCHGGVHVTRRILQALAAAGATVAEATSADAWPVRGSWDAAVLRGLETARTTRVVRLVLHQKARAPEAIRAALRLWRIDPRRGKDELQAMCDAGRRAQRLIHGATVAIVGPPNAGKSTLLNRLVGRPAALTSPLPGTTRDWVEGEVEVNGIALRLIDLAGFRDTDDPLERRAIAAAASRLKDADLCFVVVDGALPTALADLRRTAQAARNAMAEPDAATAVPLIAVLNKSDLMDAGGTPPPPVESKGEQPIPYVHISAATGEGIKLLLETCVRTLDLDSVDDDAPCVFDAAVRDRLTRFPGDEANAAAGSEAAGTAPSVRRSVTQADAILREIFGPDALDDERPFADYNQ